MIGKPVSKDEFEKVLERQRARDMLLQDLREELQAIKSGECLLYEAPEGKEIAVHFSLTSLANEIKGLKIVTEGLHIYVYRE